MTREIDLVEEVGRIHGLDRCRRRCRGRTDSGGSLTRAQALRRRVEDALAGAGLQEAITVSLVPATTSDRLRPRAGRSAPAGGRAAGPADGRPRRRAPTLVPSLLRAMRRNRSAGREDVACLEVAHLVPRPAEATEGCPTSRGASALVLAGRLGGASWRGSGHEADVLGEGRARRRLDRLGVAVRSSR